MDKNHPPGLNTKLSHVSWSFMYTTGWCMIFIHQSDYIEVKGLWNLCVATQNVHRLVLDYVTCHKKAPNPNTLPFSPKKTGEKTTKRKSLWKKLPGWPSIGGLWVYFFSNSWQGIHPLSFDLRFETEKSMGNSQLPIYDRNSIPN